MMATSPSVFGAAAGAPPSSPRAPASVFATPAAVARPTLTSAFGKSAFSAGSGIGGGAPVTSKPGPPSPFALAASGGPPSAPPTPRSSGGGDTGGRRGRDSGASEPQRASRRAPRTEAFPNRRNPSVEDITMNDSASPPSSPKNRGEGRSRGSGEGTPFQPPPPYSATVNPASSGNRSNVGSAGASPRNSAVSYVATTSVPPMPPGADQMKELLFFDLLLTAARQSQWRDAAKLVEKLATHTLTHTYGVPALERLTHAFVHRAATASSGGEPVQACLFSKPFGACMAMTVYSTHLENQILQQRPADWRSLLAEAHYCALVALKAFAETSRSIASASATPQRRASAIALVTPLLTRYRLITRRCVAGGLLVDSAAHKGQCMALFTSVQRALGGKTSVMSSTTPQIASIAAARIMSELAGTEGTEFIIQHCIPYLEWFDRTHPEEAETRVIAHFRVGEALLSNLQLGLAQNHLAQAVTLSVENASQIAILEAFVASKLAVGETPPPSFFETYELPEMEDIALALRCGNLRLFERALAMHRTWLLSRGFLFPTTCVRSAVYVQMFLRYWMEHDQVSRVDLGELREYYPNQFDSFLDLATGVVAPLLLQHRIRGYLSGHTLVLSKADPFPGWSGSGSASPPQIGSAGQLGPATPGLGPSASPLLESGRPSRLGTTVLSPPGTPLSRPVGPASPPVASAIL